jgi:hypothetical protein
MLITGLNNMKIAVEGELKKRISLNIQRMNDLIYWPPIIYGFDPFDKNWPGDSVGRALLSLCSLYKASDSSKAKKSIYKQIQTIITDLPKYVNSGGYMGELLNIKKINEQQISGNSWFIRGLCAYYRISKDKMILQTLKNILNNYIYVFGNDFQDYPIVNTAIGEVAGHLGTHIVNNWYCSSDIGCAFIMLDGLSDLYELNKEVKLKEIIEKMLEKFLEIDVVKNNFQTHAVLTSLRGMYRFYKIVKKNYYLDKIMELFNIYCSSALTFDYGNYNWFGRPSWTEPCAIVDSIILAKNLFDVTLDRKYLQFINRVYYNAFSSSQRSNGGAGCNTCLHENNSSLKVYFYEAFFCCTMRISEGLLYLKNLLYTCRGNDIYLVLNETSSFSYKHGTIKIEQEYIKGKVDTIILNIYNVSNYGKLYIYLPDNTEIIEYECAKEYLILPLVTCKVILHLKYKAYTETRNNKQIHFGKDYVLSTKNYVENGTIKVQVGTKIYSPFTNFIEVGKQKDAEDIIQEI